MLPKRYHAVCGTVKNAGPSRDIGWPHETRVLVFVRTRLEPHVMGALLNLHRRYLRTCISLLIGDIVLVSLQVYFPTICNIRCTDNIITYGVSSGDVGYVISQGLLMLLHTPLATIFTVAASLMGAKITARCICDIRKDLHDKAMALSEQDYAAFGAATPFNRMMSGTYDIQVLLIITTRTALMAAAFNNLGFIALCMVSTVLMIQGTLTLGQFQAFIFYGNMMSGPLSSLASSVNLLQAGAAAVRRAYAPLDEKELADEHPTASIDVASVKGRVEFDHVRFSYLPDRPLMSDVSFVAEEGTTVAVVGPSGAGKTTLINLLLRFYDVDGGRILLDDTDTSALSSANLREAFGMVLQDTRLLEGTIAENIAYGKLNASREEIEAAARTARCHEFITKLPDGCDTHITEERSGRSAGEKQLVSIARVVLTDPRILILDEATSQVDTRTEYLITKAMSAVMKGRTSFMIAHRPYTIKNADKIIFMEQGDAKEVDTHDELMTLDGHYAAMYRDASSTED